MGFGFAFAFSFFGLVEFRCGGSAGPGLDRGRYGTFRMWKTVEEDPGEEDQEEEVGKKVQQSNVEEDPEE